MGRVFGWILMLAAIAIGMTVYTKGFDRAYQDVFAPIESRERSGSAATHLTPVAGMADAPMEARPRVRVTEAVRQRVTADLEEGARRRGY